jgi:hypothetical protein
VLLLAIPVNEKFYALNHLVKKYSYSKNRFRCYLIVILSNETLAPFSKGFQSLMRPGEGTARDMRRVLRIWDAYRSDIKLLKRLESVLLSLHQRFVIEDTGPFSGMVSLSRYW